MPGRLCCSAPFILRGYAPPATLGYPSRSEIGSAKGGAGRGGHGGAAVRRGRRRARDHQRHAPNGHAGRAGGPPRVTRLPPRPRVLLADDHTRLREALRDLLEEIGFEVVGESGDGADAVAMARQLEPDIVVIDLRMPVLNGLDATQVVVLSAFESPELERQAREAGAFAYLDKGTMARRVHRVLLGAAVQAVLATNLGPKGQEPG